MNASKIKKVRGQSYDREAIRKMMEDGFGVKEIAVKLGIKSMQSLRHTMEAIYREIAFEEMITVENERILKLPVELGLIPCAVDAAAISSLYIVLGTLNAENISELNIMPKGEGNVLIISNASDYQNIRYFMELCGFYGEMCDVRHNNDLLQIEFPGMNFAGIDKTVLAEGIFTIEDKGGGDYRFKEIMTPYVESSEFSYNGIKNMCFTESCSLDIYTIIKKRINESGIHFHLKYDPFHCFPEEQYYLTETKQGHLTFVPLDYMKKSELETQKLAFETKARINSELLRSNASAFLNKQEIDSTIMEIQKMMLSPMLKKLEERIGNVKIPYAGNDKIDDKIKKRMKISTEQIQKNMAQSNPKNAIDILQSVLNAYMEKEIMDFKNRFFK